MSTSLGTGGGSGPDTSSYGVKCRWTKRRSETTRGRRTSPGCLSNSGEEDDGPVRGVGVWEEG